MKKINNNNNICIDHTNIKKRKFQTQKYYIKKVHTHIDKDGLCVSLKVPFPMPLVSFSSWAQNFPDYNLAKASSDGPFLPPLKLHANCILPLLLTSYIGVIYSLWLMDIVPWLEWSWKQQRLDRNTNIKFMFY